MIVVVDEGFDPHWPALTAPRSLTRLHSDARAGAALQLQNQAYPTTKRVYLGG